MITPIPWGLEILALATISLLCWSSATSGQASTAAGAHPGPVRLKGEHFVRAGKVTCFWGGNLYPAPTAAAADSTVDRIAAGGFNGAGFKSRGLGFWRPSLIHHAPCCEAFVDIIQTIPANHRPILS